jgi:flagellar motor switch protein FliM
MTDRDWQPFDLRRPTKLSRDQLRSLDLFHDTFIRRLASSMGRVARGSATVELVRSSQVSWDEFTRTLPSVTTLVTATADPLPGDLLIEMDTSLSLALASRLLGGAGQMEAPRRPSDLELPPLRRLSLAATEALGDALSQFIEVDAGVRAIDLSPQLLGLTAPSQMVLVMTYSLAIPGCGISGDVSVVLTFATLAPILEKLVAQAAERSGIDVDPGLMRSVAEQIPVVVEARLDTTTMTAGAVAGLRVGDVIVLEHRIGQPASVIVGGSPVATGHLGRRGARLAIAVADHPFDTPVGPATTAGPQSHPLTAYDDSAAFEQQMREQDARDTYTSAGPVHSLR